MDTKLAKRFAELLLAAIGSDNLSACNAANVTESNRDVCHSHDYVDANEVMADAFEHIAGREIDLQNDADCSLWNAAWSEAKAARFYVQ